MCLKLCSKMTHCEITSFGDTVDVQRRYQVWEGPKSKSGMYTAYEAIVVNLNDKKRSVRPGMIVEAFQDVECTKTGLYHVCEILRSKEHPVGGKTSFYLSVNKVVKACEVFDKLCDLRERKLHETDLLISTFQFRICADTVICVEPVVRLADKTRSEIPAGYRILVGTYKFEEVNTDAAHLVASMTPAEDVRRFYSIGHTSPKTQEPLNLIKPVVQEQPLAEQEAKEIEDKQEPHQVDSIMREAVIAGQNNAAPAEKAAVVVQKDSAQTEHAGDKRKEMHEQVAQVEKNGDKTDHVQSSIMSPQKRTKVPFNATWGPKAVPLKTQVKPANEPNSKAAADESKANKPLKKSSVQLKDSVSAIQEAVKVLEKATADANKAEVQYYALEKQLKEAQAKILKQKSLVKKAKAEIAALVNEN